MPYQYLKKARLYQLAKSLVSGDDFPKMKSIRSSVSFRVGAA